MNATTVVCPTCLKENFENATLEQQEYLVCTSCAGVYPVIYGCKMLIDIRNFLALQNDYFGAWHVSQLNALSEYKDKTATSNSLIERQDVQQVMSLMDLKDKIVLDIGSGVFNEPEYITRSQAKEIICLDPMNPDSELAYNFVGGIAEALPYPDETFDVVVFITSFDHVIDVENSIRECLRILKPSGVVYNWVEFTKNKDMMGKPVIEQLLPRRVFEKYTSKEKALENFIVNKKQYEQKLKYFEENPTRYSRLLVDKFHLRHFEQESFIKAFVKNGFLNTACYKVRYPELGTFNDFMVFKKLENLQSTAYIDDEENENICVPSPYRAQSIGEHNEDEILVNYSYEKIKKQLNEIEYLNRVTIDILRDKLYSGPFLNVAFSLRKMLAKVARRSRNYIRKKRKLTIIKNKFDEIAALRLNTSNYINKNNIILMLTTSQIEIDPRINKVAKSLAEQGYVVNIMCLSTDSNQPALKEIRVSERVYYLKVHFDHKDCNLIDFYQSRFCDEAVKLQFDFIHANDLSTLLVAWELAKLKNVPLIYDAHELWADNVIWSGSRYVRMPSYLRNFSKALEKHILKEVASFYTVSHSIVNEYEQYFGRRPLLLANYPDVKALISESNKKIKDIKEELGLAEDIFVTTYIGGVGPARNIENVIKAHKYLPKNYVLVIRGPSIEQYSQPLIKTAKKYKVADRIFILPAVGRDEVVQAMAGADCGIVMLRNLCKNFYWFYPNKFFEYSLAKLPVAVSNFPDVSNHIEREKNGVTFDPDKPKDIARALKTLGDNPALAKQLGLNGYHSIIKQYNWGNAMAIMLNEYQRLGGLKINSDKSAASLITEHKTKEVSDIVIAE